MSLKYAEQKIEEALKLSKGNALRARQQIMAWAFEDPKLLYALTKNHLTGIVAYHVDRVASGRAAKQHEAAKAAAPKKAKSPSQQKTKAAPEDDFGMSLLKAVTSSSAEIFGLEDSGKPHKRGHVSPQHVEALKAMAAKSKPKPKKSE